MSTSSSSRAITLREGENPQEFLIRLQAVFNDNSGMSRPEEYPGPQMSSYEMFLSQYFLNGLLPHVREGLETTCMFPHSERLQTVTCHASHAYTCHQEAIRRKAIRRDKELQKAIVVWNCQGGGGRRGRSRGRRWQEGCFICGDYDHWMRDCPQNTGYRSRQWGRAMDGCFICGDYDHWMRDCSENTGYCSRQRGRTNRFYSDDLDEGQSRNRLAIC